MRHARFPATVGLLALLAAAPAKQEGLLPRNEQTGKYALEEVVHIQGAAVDELFRRASAWVTATYASASDQLQLSDKPAGRLIAKGHLVNSYEGKPAWVEYTLTIEVKEGRYRYVVTDFVFTNAFWGIHLEEEEKLKGGFKKPLEKFRAQVLALAEDLRVAMLKPAPPEG